MNLHDDWLLNYVCNFFGVKSIFHRNFSSVYCIRHPDCKRSQHGNETCKTFRTQSIREHSHQSHTHRHEPISKQKAKRTKKYKN